MARTMDVGSAIAGTIVGLTTTARETGAAKLKVIHRELVGTMPRAATQELRVLHATLEPGDTTPFHTHRFPVTVHILEGAFTLELEGREAVTLRAGETFVEPPHVRMTGSNRSATETNHLVIFYVSDPDTPFADPVD
jgi:quercetin dioxygenase-like cupin family protein